MTKTQIRKTQPDLEQWASLSSEKKMATYLASIPEQVHASMAFEGEHVSLRILKEYMKSLKSTTRPPALRGWRNDLEYP